MYIVEIAEIFVHYFLFYKIIRKNVFLISITNEGNF